MPEQPRSRSFASSAPLSPNGHALAALGMALVLAACGDSRPPVQQQVAARVNAEEISMLQVNHALARLPEVSPEQIEKQRREALDLLVDQQLVAQAAIKQGMERDPEVIGSLAAARSEILARTYMSRLVAALPAPTDEEVAAYYDSHPLLYAQRRYYVLREIALPAKDAPVPALRAMAARGSVDGVAAWLRAQGRTHSVSASTRPAEDIPAPVLQAVSQLRPGEAAVVPTPDGVFVVHLVSMRDAPIDAVAAQARIRRALLTERARGAMAGELARIRSTAKIEYREGAAPEAVRTRPAGTVKVADPLAAKAAASPVTQAVPPAASAGSSAGTAASGSVLPAASAPAPAAASTNTSTTTTSATASTAAAQTAQSR
jgi:EpsD family peptidyl-prolyl cis-trans isomerase